MFSLPLSLLILDIIYLLKYSFFNIYLFVCLFIWLHWVLVAARGIFYLRHAES